MFRPLLQRKDNLSESINDKNNIFQFIFHLPFAAQTIANEIPVFPLVASTTVCPGFKAPILLLFLFQIFYSKNGLILLKKI